MNEIEKDLNRVAASKRLSRFKLSIDDNLMKVNVIWCRTAYGSAGDKPSQNNKHSFYELHYVLKGCMDIVFDNDSKYTLCESEFLIVPPNYFHYTENVIADTEKFVCGFTIRSDAAFIKDALTAIESIEPRRESGSMRTLVDLLLLNAYDAKPAAPLVITDLLECLLIEFFRQICPSPPEKNYDLKVFENDKRIEEAQRYIEDNIAAALTVDDIARHLNVSARHLNRLSHMYLGCPINKIISDCRVKYIKELLTSPDLTLSDISEMTGFSSEYSMNRFFKHNEGMSVGLFRRSIEK